MERFICNEFCCAASSPAAPDYCLHIAMLYRLCTRRPRLAPVPDPAPDPSVSPAPPLPPSVLPLPARSGAAPPQPASAFSTPSSSAFPSPPASTSAPPSSYPPGGPRYPVYRLIYEASGHPPLHKLYVQTDPAGARLGPTLGSAPRPGDNGPAIRGLYLHVTGSPEAGMRYAETPGDDPERAIPRGLRAKTLVGTIAAADLDRLCRLCRRVPPPCRQFDECRRLLAWVPLRRSQEWTQESIETAVAIGILDIALCP